MLKCAASSASRRTCPALLYSASWARSLRCRHTSRTSASRTATRCGCSATRTACGAGSQWSSTWRSSAGCAGWRGGHHDVGVDADVRDGSTRSAFATKPRRHRALATAASQGEARRRSHERRRLASLRGASPRSRAHPGRASCGSARLRASRTACHCFPVSPRPPFRVQAYAVALHEERRLLREEGKGGNSASEEPPLTL